MKERTMICFTKLHSLIFSMRINLFCLSVLPFKWIMYYGKSYFIAALSCLIYHLTLHKILLSKQECYTLQLDTIPELPRMHRSTIKLKGQSTAYLSSNKLWVAGGFCNENDLKPWDLQFQQLIWKLLLKTPKQSISAMILTNSITLHTSSQSLLYHENRC